MKNKLKLEKLLILYMVVILTGSLLITFIYLSNAYRKTMTKQLATARVEVLQQISKNANTVIEDIVKLSNLYYHYLNNSLVTSAGHAHEFELDFQSLDSITSMLGNSVDFFYEFLSFDGLEYHSFEGDKLSINDISNKIWFEDLISSDGNPLIITTHEISEKNVITIGRVIKDAYDKAYGVLLLNVSEDEIFKTYGALLDQSSIYIVDGKGKIVSHSDKDMLGVNFYDMSKLSAIFGSEYYKIINKNGVSYLFSIYVDDIGWCYVEEIPLSIVVSSVNTIFINSFIVIIIILLIGIAMSFYIAHFTTQPLQTLLFQLKRFGHGDNDHQYFSVSGWREIAELCSECNSMSDRIQTLVENIKRKDSAKRRAEIGFLQSQMNPHFMYNTLFSIRCCIEMNDKEKSISMIDSFTSMLKYMLSYKNEFIKVEDEISMLDEYAALQKIRYGDEINIDISSDDESYELYIPRMIIQPLIENSLFHGKKQGECINISIEFISSDDSLRIIVDDDGIGFTDEKFSKLYESMKNENSISNKIGLKNIRERIKMLFGDEYSISIEQDNNSGARVIIKIPRITEANEE